MTQSGNFWIHPRICWRVEIVTLLLIIPFYPVSLYFLSSVSSAPQ